ncbi:MAG: Flp pilus assembly protein CpaB [Spirochaetes bacterium]|nr:Flp pilus assembly protein CpaB [Spirochaetota bacterium]
MKSKIAKIIAFFAAVFGILGFLLYLNKVEEDVALESNLKNVAVAKMYIPKYAVIKPEMIRIQQVPVKYLQPGAVTSIKELLSQERNKQYVTLVPVMEGEMILSTKISMPGQNTGLSVVIPSGKRAISVPISTDTDVSLIKPGNKIDLISTFADKSVYLLQNLVVLSVGNSIIGELENEGRKSKSVLGSISDMATGGGMNITLAVTPMEALKIAYARGKCDFNVVLRNAVDDTVNKVTPIGNNNLLDEKVKFKDSVEVIRGVDRIKEFFK